MKKRSIRLIPFLALLFFCNSVYAIEPVKINNGQVIFAYRANEIPSARKHKNCDAQACQDQSFTPLTNGHYKSGDNEFMIQNDCIFPKLGQSTLKDGTPVEFYEAGEFADTLTEGNAVFIKDKFVNEAVLQLKNAQSITIENGHIINGDFFDKGRIFYPDFD